LKNQLFTYLQLLLFCQPVVGYGYFNNFPACPRYSASHPSPCFYVADCDSLMESVSVLAEKQQSYRDLIHYSRDRKKSEISPLIFPHNH